MPNLVMTPKGRQYFRSLDKSMGEGPVSDFQDDDWDILYEMDHTIERWGSVSDNHLLGMPDRSQGLGSMDTWDDEEERSRIRASLRRMFEEGIIAHAP